MDWIFDHILIQVVDIGVSVSRDIFYRLIIKFFYQICWSLIISSDLMFSLYLFNFLFIRQMNIPNLLLQFSLFFIKLKQIIFNKRFHIKILLMSSYSKCRFRDGRYWWIFHHTEWLLSFGYLLRLGLRVARFLCWCCSLAWISSISYFLQAFLSLFLECCLLGLFCFLFWYRSVSILILISEWSVSDYFFRSLLLLRYYFLFLFAHFVLFFILWLILVLRFALEFLHGFITWIFGR